MSKRRRNGAKQVISLTVDARGFCGRVKSPDRYDILQYGQPISRRRRQEKRTGQALEGAFSRDEIHRLRRLRRDGFPERLSRSYRLAQTGVARACPGIFACLLCRRIYTSYRLNSYY